MDSGNAGPSSQDKGKGKAPHEDKKKSKRAGKDRTAGKSKKKAPRTKGACDKWKPGDPLPDSPTAGQIKAHNVALIDAYVSELLPERDLARGWGRDSRYEELLWNYRYVPPEEGLPEGAETHVVPKDDLKYLSESSGESSEYSSEESESESEDSDSDSQ